MTGTPLSDSVERLARRSGADRHDVAVVLGSGWKPAADLMGEVVWEGAWSELGGFPAPTAEGHGGTVRSIALADGRRALAFTGRVHAYEGHALDVVTRAVRLAAAAGAGVLALTNAAGGLDPDWGVGQPVLIRDHLNMTGRSPLVGAHFVDLTDAYSPRLRELARSVDPSLPDGVYAAMPGPHYETPAEVRMLRTLGADLVGMSTVHETIAARSLGMEVLGMSLVTNPAAGTTGAPLSHAEVLAAGAAAAQRMGRLLADVLSSV